MVLINSKSECNLEPHYHSVKSEQLPIHRRPLPINVRLCAVLSLPYQPARAWRVAPLHTCRRTHLHVSLSARVHVCHHHAWFLTRIAAIIDRLLSLRVPDITHVFMSLYLLPITVFTIIRSCDQLLLHK